MNVPLARPVMTKDMIDAAMNALANERLLLGESVFKFEEAFAKMCGVSHAVSVNSGTSAIQLALLAAGLKAGDKVATTAASFVATSNAFLYFGATPAFSDILQDEYTLDPSKVKLDAKTRAIIPVHLYGHVARMDEINELAKKAGNVIVLEDACQAHGALYKGRRAGALGDVGCFSFYSTKNMTVGGDGGMVTTNDDSIAKAIIKLRNCGRNPLPGDREDHDVIGYTARLNTVNAAIGLVQLRHLEEWNERHRTIAAIYHRRLSSVRELRLPPAPSKDVTPVYYVYAVMTRRRDELREFLKKRGVGTGVHYWKPIHLQPVYRQMFGYREGMLPITEKCFSETLSLPMFSEMTDEQANYVCDCVLEFFG